MGRARRRLQRRRFSRTKGTSNEDPTHEAAESPEREAAEDNGTAGFGDHHDGGSNEDPAHEATESPAREAEEDARGAGTAPAETPVTTAPASAAGSNT